MTNEELIAQARELCKKEIGFYNRQLEIYPKDSEPYKRHLVLSNSWATHLAEMDEHEGIHTDYGYVCKKCSMSFSKMGMTICLYPCDFLVTKAKRLLGEENV